MRRLLWLMAIGALMITVSPCWAGNLQGGIPHLINYQGVLTDDVGNPLDDSYDLTFSIYRYSTEGSPLWTETHTAISVQDGIFNVILGSDSPIPDSVFEWSMAYLGIKIGAGAELTPRTRFTSTAYAYRAETATMAETDGDWMTLENNNIIFCLTDSVGIGMPSPSEKLDVGGTVQMTGFKLPTDATDGWVLTSNSEGVGTWETPPTGLGGNGTTGYIPRFITSTALGNSEVYQYGSSIGIGITVPKVKLDVSDMIRVQDRTWPSSGKGMELAYYPAGNTGYIQVYDRDASPPNDWGKLYLGNGEVGVGTSNPGVKLQVSGGTDVDDNTENTGYLIVGSATGSHIAFDNNEIMAKSSGTSAGGLYIQNEGGGTRFGGDVNIDGKINGAVGVVAMGSYYDGTLYDALNVGSVSWSPTLDLYEIQLTGITYDPRNYITIVTPVSTSNPYIATTAYFATYGYLRVYFWNTSGSKVQCNRFHFVVYNKE